MPTRKMDLSRPPARSATRAALTRPAAESHSAATDRLNNSNVKRSWLGWPTQWVRSPYWARRPSSPTPATGSMDERRGFGHGPAERRHAGDPATCQVMVHTQNTMLYNVFTFAYVLLPPPRKGIVT